MDRISVNASQYRWEVPEDVPDVSGNEASHGEAPGLTSTTPASEQEQKVLLLDLTQATLSIAGILDPTPISDGLDAIISAGRGDWTGAGISVAGMIPYLGDLAKIPRLGHLGKTLGKVLEYVTRDEKFAETARPALARLKNLVDRMPTSTLPEVARESVEALRSKLGNFLKAAVTAVERQKIADAIRPGGLEAILRTADQPAGQITQGARALTKKLGHAASEKQISAFEGIVPNRSNALALIEGILDNPASVVVTKTRLDVYNALGQGVRIDLEKVKFMGFLEANQRTR